MNDVLDETNGKNDSHDEALERFSTLIAQNLSHDMSEEFLLSGLEEFFSPRPAKLFSSDEERDALQEKTDRLARRFSRVGPLVILPLDADPSTGKVKIDTYYASLGDEWISYFYKCRRSICRTHMYYTTHGALVGRPEFWPNMPDEVRMQASDLMETRFWDSLEVATTRMASYWDRVGQIMDFVFFNIRQYEKDGFPSVMDRIRKNFIPRCPAIAGSEAWKKIRRYANSEDRSGYKWLVRRRNLIVHSLQLRPHRSINNDPIYEYEFNHYSERITRDLAVTTARDELENIHVHLSAAATLVPFVIELASLGLDAVEQEISMRR